MKGSPSSDYSVPRDGPPSRGYRCRRDRVHHEADGDKAERGRKEVRRRRRRTTLDNPLLPSATHQCPYQFPLLQSQHRLAPRCNLQPIRQTPLVSIPHSLLHRPLGLRRERRVVPASGAPPDCTSNFDYDGCNIIEYVSQSRTFDRLFAGV